MIKNIKNFFMLFDFDWKSCKKNIFKNIYRFWNKKRCLIKKNHPVFKDIHVFYENIFKIFNSKISWGLKYKHNILTIIIVMDLNFSLSI